MKMPNTTTIDLRKLSQYQLAWILDKPPHWIRSNAQIFERDADGKYNAKQAVQAFIASRPAKVVLIQ
jgi:hypothetical protein